MKTVDFIKTGPFVRKYEGIGKLIPIREFGWPTFIPSDGIAGCIVLDGMRTNLTLRKYTPDWMSEDVDVEPVMIDLADLQKLSASMLKKGECTEGFSVDWYNK